MLSLEHIYTQPKNLIGTTAIFEFIGIFLYSNTHTNRNKTTTNKGTKCINLAQKMALRYLETNLKVETCYLYADHEIISKVILFRPLIQEGLLSVTTKVCARRTGCSSLQGKKCG